MLRRVAFARTDVSEELSTSFITVTRVGELGAVTSNHVRRLLVVIIIIKKILSRNEKENIMPLVTGNYSQRICSARAYIANGTLCDCGKWCLLGCYAVWLL
jgi:hypothetical protein